MLEICGSCLWCVYAWGRCSIRNATSLQIQVTFSSISFSINKHDTWSLIALNVYLIPQLVQNKGGKMGFIYLLSLLKHLQQLWQGLLEILNRIMHIKVLSMCLEHSRWSVKVSYAILLPL